MGRAAAATLAALSAVLWPASPATAGPGDAEVRGVSFAFWSRYGPPVLETSATFGEVTTPATDGTERVTDVPVALPDVDRVTMSGIVEEVTASRSPSGSETFARVSGVRLSMFGVEVVSVAEATGTTRCGRDQPPSATATSSGVELFGEPVELGDDRPRGGPVTVPGLASATLRATVDQTLAPHELTAAGHLLVSLSLEGRTTDGEYVLSFGSLSLASAICERPLLPRPPVATSLLWDSGPQSGGQANVIYGEHFVPGATTVTFDGVPVETTAVSRRQVNLVPPPHPPGPVTILVRTPYGVTGPLTYTYLLDGSGAAVTGLSPDSGTFRGGTRVTLTGSGLTGATGVRFGGQFGDDVRVDPSGTTITVTTPRSPGGGPAQVDVVFPGGRITAPVRFEYFLKRILSISPGTGPSGGGTTLTITGYELAGVTGVVIGGIFVRDFEVNREGTTVTVVTPRRPPGPANVVLLFRYDNLTVPNGFTYLRPPPPTDPPPGPPGGQPAEEPDLPVTGAATATTAALGAGLLLVGVGLVGVGLLLTRRRRGTGPFR